MVRDNFRHKHGYFVRRIEFPRLLASVSGEHADQILVDEPQHVITLLAIHGYVFDELDELADGLGLFRGSIAQFA